MNSRRFTLSDLLVSILIVAVVATFAVAAEKALSEKDRRTECAKNLKQIGLAMLLYANENRQSYPRTITNIDKPDPVWGTPYEDNVKLGAIKEGADPFAEAKPGAPLTSPKDNDVTAAMFLLLRTQDIDTSVFICPSTAQYPSRIKIAPQWTNFGNMAALRAHLSYSMQNPYPSRQGSSAGFRFTASMNPESALFADMNPGVDALLKLKVDSTQESMNKGNSFNHGREGQNVLYGDGHVEFKSNPFVGAKRDNIYTYGESGKDHPDQGGKGIVGASVNDIDSILLPTSRHLGMVDADGKPIEQAKPNGANTTRPSHQ